MWKWQNGVAEGRQKISKLNIGNNNGILGARVCQLCWLTWCSSLLLVGTTTTTTTSSIWVYRFIVVRGSRDLCSVQKEIKISQLYNRKRLFIRQNSVGETIFYSSLKVVYCYSFFWLQILSGKYSFNLLLARLFFFTFQWRETFL